MIAKTGVNAAAAAGRVLVVDDDEMSRRLLCDILSMRGYTVFDAADGEAALSEVAASQPDVILLDVMMPRLDGMEVCRRLKADALTAPIPVLLVTALHERADRLKGVASGANDFITKPIDTEEVLLRVRNALCLKRLYDERNALLRLREELSDMIVHDLRNPLLGIMLSALRIEALDVPPPARALARTIRSQVDLADRFVTDLLEVSRMEHAGFTLNRTRVDLTERARTAALSLLPHAEAKRIRIRIEVPEAPCLVDADEGLLVRLIDNLLSNAVKFSPENSEVQLRVCPADGKQPVCRIHVQDDGPGVPVGFREAIFDKFACVKMKAFAARQTGLGLTFCRMVAEAHGGRIYVEERKPRGAVFTVELPPDP
jgi:signal transduction histidine kinase